ncbi:hypothetical protein GOODEAATRI_024037, partial [Goodea atripinnis]
SLLEHNPGGVVLSTDDYFSCGGGYQFDPMALGEAHEWNHKRAREAFERGINPIIIDNTNMQEWEMKPYVLYSSLPDVSSISGSEEVGMHDDASCESTESLDLQSLGKQTSKPDTLDGDDDFYSSDMDSELNTLLELNRPKGDGRIPDCIVESVINEDHYGDEVPVAFCESIAQRVKRERSSRSGFDQAEAADLLKDTNPSNKETLKDKLPEEHTTRNGEEKENSEMLEFVGDWPSEGSLQQRMVKRGERHRGMEEKEIVDDEKTKVRPSGPDITEFQKLLDLIQTGLVTDQMSSSCSLSISSDEEFDKEDEAGGMAEEVHASSSEEKQQNTGKADLPDCVQDWKVNKSPTSADGCEAVERESRARTNPERDTNVSETGKELMKSTDECSDKVDLKETHRPVGAEWNTKQVNESPDSLAPELFAETESCGSSQEKKQQHGRRSGKQCKLALTFSHSSSMNNSDCPKTTAENMDNNKSTNSDVKPTSSDPKPDLGLLFQTHPELPAPLALVETGCFTQAEPRDFALLWRLNCIDGSSGAPVTASGHASDIRVLEANSSHFMPELSSAAADVYSSSHMDVPYRVVHEKGTQVEEKELGVTQDRLQSLRILSRHFKLVSFDTLEDLYDKCGKDLEWTTNLLLDSGERFFRDEDGEEVHIQSSNHTEASVSNTGNCLEPVNDYESKGDQTRVEEEAQESTGTTNETNEGCDVPFGGESIPLTAKEQPDPASDLEQLPQTEPGPPEAADKVERSSNTGHLVAEADFEDGAWGRSEDDEEAILEFENETVDDIASMDEINRLLQAELEEMEREESQRKAERRSQHLDIQTVELKLPTELALQLTELFGPVGVDPGCRGDPQVTKHGSRKRTQPGSILTSKDGDMSLARQPDESAQIPFMDHWNVSHPHVSLREIIKEEQALQENMQKVSHPSKCFCIT